MSDRFEILELFADCAEKGNGEYYFAAMSGFHLTVASRAGRTYQKLHIDRSACVVCGERYVTHRRWPAEFKRSTCSKACRYKLCAATRIYVQTLTLYCHRGHRKTGVKRSSSVSRSMIARCRTCERAWTAARRARRAL